MEDPNIVAMIDSWIADYYSHLVWKQFDIDGCIGVRDYISLQPNSNQHISKFNAVLEDRELKSLTHEMNPRLLIDFMCKISCGEKVFEEVGKSGHTLLEEAIGVLDNILNAAKPYSRLDRDSIEQLKLLLKQQAVLVCCRKNEFDLANEVFGRQWRYWKNQNEMETREKILHVIEQRNSDHKYLDLMPYSLLVDNARTLLREIFGSLKTPFLVTAAQSVSSNYSSIVQKHNSLKCQNLPKDKRQTSNSSIEDTGTNNPMPSNNGKRNQLESRRVETKTAADQKQISDSKATVSADKSTLKSGSPKTNTTETVAEGSTDVEKSKRTFHDVRFTSSRTESPINDIEQDSPNDTTTKRKSRETNPESLDWETELRSPVLPSTESRSRKFWKPNEEERLYLGVQKYGVGQWRKVASFLGSNRSNVDVKDKWRTMIKQGRLKAYEKKFGPIET